MDHCQSILWPNWNRRRFVIANSLMGSFDAFCSPRINVAVPAEIKQVFWNNKYFIVYFIYFLYFSCILKCINFQLDYKENSVLKEYVSISMILKDRLALFFF